ncbi:MAG: acyl carrier protein [Atopobiaceae bacterium]|nr:acyl carrier protein [Atopobiaceae bacterium]
MNNAIKDKVIEILSSIKSGVDFANEDQIVTGGILDSIDITEFITALEEEFDIEIGMEYMENENFDSVDAICEMVEELQEA